MTMKWEYTHRTFFGDRVYRLVDDLNALGQEGWEAVHFQHSYIPATDEPLGRIATNTTVLFKRPIYESGIVQLFGGDEEEDDTP